MKNHPLKKLWFIRHAEAVEADEFDGNDLERPLTKRGRRSAEAAFKKFSRLRSCPGIVISSKAKRARETAEIFCRSFGIRNYEKTELLNPGCSFRDIRRVIQTARDTIEFVALVGHEPDFSMAVSRLTSSGTLSLALKKCGIAELELNKSGTFELTMLIPPDILK